MGKTRIYTLAILSALSIAATGTALGHGENHQIGADEHPDIKLRHTLMDNAGFATKTAGKMIKGEAPYDAAKAELAMRSIETTAHTMDKYFSPASRPGPNSKSEAAPKIWEDMQGFLAEVEKFKKVASAAVKPAGQGADAFRAAFISVTKSCKSCHESYRIKKQ